MDIVKGENEVVGNWVEAGVSALRTTSTPKAIRTKKSFAELLKERRERGGFTPRNPKSGFSIKARAEEL